MILERYIYIDGRIGLLFLSFHGHMFIKIKGTRTDLAGIPAANCITFFEHFSANNVVVGYTKDFKFRP